MVENFELFVEFMEKRIPFNKYLGIKVDHVEKGFARIILPYQEQFLGDARRPALHGGVISTLVDTCGGLAVWTFFSRNAKIATIDMRVDYLRPGGADALCCESKVNFLGSRVGNVHSVVYSGTKKRHAVAEGRAVYNIRGE